MFRDYLCREIKVGDVLACGQRQGSHGGVRIGIVRGFTEKTILADMLRGKPGCRDHKAQRFTRFVLQASHFNADYNCCITGMSEEELRATVPIGEAQ